MNEIVPQSLSSSLRTEGRGRKQGQRTKRERESTGGERKKREKGSFRKLLDRRHFLFHQGQNPAVKRHRAGKALTGQVAPRAEACGRNINETTQWAGLGVSGSSGILPEVSRVEETTQCSLGILLVYQLPLQAL